MDASQFREAAHAAIEEVISYFNNIRDLRVTPAIKPGYLRPQLPTAAPAHPEPWSNVLSDVSTKIIPGLTHWQSPNFFAFFPAAVSYPSILGELFSAAFTAPAFNWVCSPACTELETVVLDWIAQALGLPDVYLSSGEGGGVIQGSASEAIVVAMVAARERAVRRALEAEGLMPEQADESEETKLKREDRVAAIRGQLVAIGSEQSHSSTQKAANILGVRYRSARAGAASNFALTGASLREKLVECEAKGLKPFYLTATMGTTSVCAIDEFEEIAAVKRDYPDLWVHVDAAYAGAALICPEMREELKAKSLDQFESFDVNLHKWLLVNFDASCFFVQRRADLHHALSISPSYLLNPADLSGLVTDYRDWQIPLGRRFRALKIWFVLRSYGINALQSYVRKHCAYAEVFDELCRSRAGKQRGLVVVAGPKFALTVVRCSLTAATSKSTLDATSNPDDEMNTMGKDAGTAGTVGDVPSTPESDAFTKQVYELINSRGDIFLTSSVIDGSYCIRVVGANPNTTEADLRHCFDVLIETIDELRGTK